MQTSTNYTFTISPNGVYRLQVSGQYFKILAATGAVDIRSETVDLKSMITGQGMENEPFTYLTFKDVSGVSNTLKIVVADGGFIDGMTGTMAVTSNTQTQRGTFVNANSAVTNASTQLLAANANRQYLLIQNKDLTGNVYLVFGAAATVALGIKIAPGGSMELANTISTQAIFAIGDIANNANVVTLEA